MNLAMLIGNVTRDPELKYTPSGTAILNYSIAVNHKYGDKEETLFMECTMFGKFAETMNQYLKKGGKVAVSGMLKQDTWTAQDGTKRSKIYLKVDDLQLLGCKGGNSANGGNNNNRAPKEPPVNTYSASEAPQDAIPEIDVDEESIPF